MKVINNDTNSKTYKETCSCGAELEFTKEDIHTGAFGSCYVTCPICNTEIEADKATEDGLGKTITIGNIEFPQDFTDNKDAIHIEDDKVNKYIFECLKELENDKKDFGTYTFKGTGDTMVIIFKFEDEYDVIVTQDYYQTSIERK